MHVRDALENGASTCIIRTVDTDVVVILIGKFQNLLAPNSSADIWVAFRTGKTFTQYHINIICQSSGPSKITGIPHISQFYWL